MMTNTAGTLPKIFRSGIGKGRVVVAIIIVVQSVPRFMIMYTIRIRIFVLRTNVMPANTAGVGRIYFRTPEDNGKGRVVMAMIIVVNFVPNLMTVFRSQRERLILLNSNKDIYQIISTSLERKIIKNVSSKNGSNYTVQATTLRY